MKKFKPIRHMLSQTLEIPEDVLGNTFRLQIIGNCAILCGCRKLLKYKSEEIVVLTNEGILTFNGENLKCKYFYEGTVELIGAFNNVRIENK